MGVKVRKGSEWVNVAAGGGSGTVTEIDVAQYSDEATPRTERTCSNPIDVLVNAGITTIGIGSTSNAYGNKYVQDTEPSSSCDGDIWFDTSGTSAAPAGVSKVGYVYDQKGQDVGGGEPPDITTFNTRDLNTISDPHNIGITSTTDGVITLPAGTYAIEWGCPSYRSNQNQTQLVYDDNSAFSSPTTVLGSSAYNQKLSQIQTRSFGKTTVVGSSTIYFKVTHRVSSLDGASDGFGVKANLGVDNIYTIVKVEDLKTAVRQDGTSIVKQLVNGTTSTEVSHTNAAYSSTGLSGTITLSNASNKVLVMVNQNVYAYDNDGQVDFSIKIVRTIGATSVDVWLPGAVNPWTQDASSSSCQLGLQATIIYVDTPSHVGPITYHTEARGGDTTCTSQKGGDFVSNIVLQEVT